MAKPFEVGKTYKDARGDDVRIICNDRAFSYEREQWPLVGAKKDSSTGNEILISYKADGSTFPTDRRLVPEKNVLEGWIRVFERPTGSRFFGSMFFDSKEQAMDWWFDTRAPVDVVYVRHEY